jgi:phospholipase A1
MPMPNNTKAALFLLGLSLGGAAAADDQPGSSEPCASIDDDRARLACYDRAGGRVPEAPGPGLGAPPLPEERSAQAGDFVGGGDSVRTGASRLGFKWELDEDSRFGALRFRTHKPNYFLPITHSDGRNNTPYSPSLGPAGTADLEDNEAKFQLSFKTKLVEGMMNDRIDVWAAYTQQSHWQIYSPSAPFRETNYEP